MSLRNERENSEINEYSSTKKTYPWYLFFLDHAFTFSFWLSIATSLQEDIQLPSSSAFTLLCSSLPRYISTGWWDLQNMAKVMKLEGFVTEGIAASVLVSWIACSEGNPLTMLWGHSSNSGERPPRRGAEASCRQPSKLAGHASESRGSGSSLCQTFKWWQHWFTFNCDLRRDAESELLCQTTESRR